MKALHSFCFLVLALAFTFMGCSEGLNPTDPGTPETQAIGPLATDQPCGEPLDLPLMTGLSHRKVGMVNVSNDPARLTILLDTSLGPWVLSKTHITVATGPPGWPGLGRGNQQARRFVFSEEYDPPVSTAVLEIDLEEHGLMPGQDLVLTVRSVVNRQRQGGHVVGREVAWAASRQRTGQGWGRLVRYTLQECEVPDPCEITLLEPDGGEAYCYGIPVTILWTAAACGSEVRVELLWEGGLCQILAESTENDGYFVWYAAPCDPSQEDQYTVRITDLESGTQDTSNGTFVIYDCGGGGGE